MGYWENTTYLRCTDLGRIESALAALFAAEGYLEVSRPRPRRPARYDSMQYKTSADNPLWSLALIPASKPWTIIKTAPLELLGERAPRGKRLRIADLCATLGCDAFIDNTYDSAERILVEADAKGRVRVSGGSERHLRCEGDVFEILPYNGEPFFEGGWGFGLIEVSEDIRAAYEAFPDDQTLGRLLGGDTEAHSNDVCVGHLIPHADVTIPGAKVLYFRRK